MATPPASAAAAVGPGGRIPDSGTDPARQTGTPNPSASGTATGGDLSSNLHPPTLLASSLTPLSVPLLPTRDDPSHRDEPALHAAHTPQTDTHTFRTPTSAHSHAPTPTPSPPLAVARSVPSALASVHTPHTLPGGHHFLSPSQSHLAVRPLQRSASSNSFDGSSRHLTPRQLRSYEQSDGITVESAYDALHSKQRPVLMATPRNVGGYTQLADRSPIPVSIQTIPIDSVAMPNWRLARPDASVPEDDDDTSRQGRETSRFDETQPATTQDESPSPPSATLEAARAAAQTGLASTPPPAVSTPPVATPSLARRASLVVFHSLAMQKLALEGAALGSLPLQEWLTRSQALMHSMPNDLHALPPLDLRGPDAAHRLSEWVSATLEMDLSNIRAVQVVSSPSTSNAHAVTASAHSTAYRHLTMRTPDAPSTVCSFRTSTATSSSTSSSGDAVSLILDTSRSPPKLVAVVKVFSSHRTFEEELVAITRMHAWIDDDNADGRTMAVTVNGESVPEKSGDSQSVLERISSSDVQTSSSGLVSVAVPAITSPASLAQSTAPILLRVPTAIGAHFALTPAGKGGVLVMSAAAGVPLDDLFFELSRKRADSSAAQCESAWLALKAGIGCAAIAFALLHSRPRGSGGKVRKKYMQRYAAQIDHIMERIEQQMALEDNTVSEVSRLMTQFPSFRHLFDMASLRLRLRPLIDAAIRQRGLSCVVHGDAHMSNIFYDDSAHVVTLIDVPTVNLSVGEHGEPIGCAARDVANVYQKIAVTGDQYQCTTQEVQRLQSHFLDTYERQLAVDGRPSPLSMESFHFFHMRSIVGELHRRIKTHSVHLHALTAIDHALLQAETFYQRKTARSPAPMSIDGVAPPDSFGDDDDLQDDRVALQLLDEELAQEKLDAEELRRKELERAELREQDALAEASVTNDEEEEERDLLFDEEEEEDISTAPPKMRNVLDGFVKDGYAGRDASSADAMLYHQYGQDGATPSYGYPAALPVSLPPAPPPSSTSINGGRVLVVLGAPLKSDLQTPDVWLESRLKQAVSIFYRVQPGLSALILSGGRCPDMEVSIAKVMERWLRPFGIRSQSSRFALMTEDMSSCVSAESYPRDLISQAFCIRSQLRVRGFRHGNILVVCSDFQLASVCMVFNRIFKSATGMITLEYSGAPTPRAYAPETRVEAARLKELPLLMKEMRGRFTAFAPYGRCSLLDAARAGSLQSLRLMTEVLGGGPTLINSEKDALGCSPLHIAAECGFDDCCAYLLQHGADPNARSTLGATPLHFATAMARLDVVQLLLRFGGGPSRTLVGVCGRGEGRDCWLGSKRPCDMHKHDAIPPPQSTHSLQDRQPALSTITLLVQPESVTLEEATEDIRREHDAAARRMRLMRSHTGASRPNSQNSVHESPNQPAQVTLAWGHDDGDGASDKKVANDTRVQLQSPDGVVVSSSLPLPPSSSLVSCVPSPLRQYPNLSHKRILLLRHSESLWNVNGSHRVRGLIDTTLTNTGVKQAKQLGSLLQQTGALQRIGTRLIVVSPLTRTLQTYMLAARWYVDMFPQGESPRRDESNERDSTTPPGSSLLVPPVAAPTTVCPVRVVVNSDLAEQLLSTGTIGRSPEQLQKDFDDPTLDFSKLAPVWWFAPQRDDAPPQTNSNNGEAQASATPNTPRNAADSHSLSNSSSASSCSCGSGRLPSAPSNTRVYLKREPLEHVRMRIHMFLHWLDQQPETSVLVVGHGTYFRYLVDHEMKYPDLFKANLFAWRL